MAKKTLQDLSVETAEEISICRAVETLHETPVNEMSTSEMRSYIEFLRGEFNKAISQLQLLDGNCQSAYETLRMTQQSLLNHKDRTTRTERFILQAVKTMHDSLLLAMAYKEEPTNGN